MENKNLILLAALGAGAVYLMNQQNQQQHPPQGSQQYAPQNNIAYQQQQPDYLDKINNTITNVSNVVNTGKDILESIGSLFTKPSYKPPYTPLSLPRTNGSWA